MSWDDRSIFRCSNHDYATERWDMFNAHMLAPEHQNTNRESWKTYEFVLFNSYTRKAFELKFEGMPEQFSELVRMLSTYTLGVEITV